MNSLVEAEIRNYLTGEMHYDPYQAGTIVFCMRALARAGGYDLDEHFAQASLGAGPEARVASTIVERALGGGGCETSMYTIRRQIEDWLRTTPLKGAIA